MVGIYDWFVQVTGAEHIIKISLPARAEWRMSAQVRTQDGLKVPCGLVSGTLESLSMSPSCCSSEID